MTDETKPAPPARIEITFGDDVPPLQRAEIHFRVSEAFEEAVNSVTGSSLLMRHDFKGEPEEVRAILEAMHRARDHGFWMGFGRLLQEKTATPAGVEAAEKEGEGRP